MKTKQITIENIPAILWGEDSEQIILAVHGNMSSKSDTWISILAELSNQKRYQVLSFDLPKHGDRKEELTPCKVQNCLLEMKKIMDFVRIKRYSL